jgi:hypothetical protein
MRTPRTRAASDLLEWLRSERRFWQEAAHADEVNTFVRHGAISRRDQLDMLLMRLPRELVRIEDEADAEAERLTSAVESVA